MKNALEFATLKYVLESRPTTFNVCYVSIGRAKVVCAVRSRIKCHAWKGVVSEYTVRFSIYSASIDEHWHDEITTSTVLI